MIVTTAAVLQPKAHDHASCAGTPLGDPVELGAAAAVFLDAKTNGDNSSLTLLAAKSWVGHSEPAAGIAGIAHAKLALQHHMQLPILHLGQVNPHVASALQGPARSHCQMPRQQAGMLGMLGMLGGDDSNPRAVLRCGVSAFAFQVSILVCSNGCIMCMAYAMSAAPSRGSLFTSQQL